jgi:PPM family protein phosphatase
MHGIQWGSVTNIGLKRRSNEDSIFLVNSLELKDEFNRLGIMFAVADGMSGQPGGKIASKLACDSLISYYMEKPQNGIGQLPIELLREHLKKVIFEIDMKVFEHSKTDQTITDMGTTLSVLVLTNRSAIIAHVGDSRIYRIRKKQLKQLTEDHTFVQEMIEEGELKPDEVSSHPLRHVLTQVIGTEERLEKVFSCVETIVPGDSFLLCTDGLHNMVPDNIILDSLSYSSNPQKKAVRLVDLALKKGGEDNISVIVVQV